MPRICCILLHCAVEYSSGFVHLCQTLFCVAKCTVVSMGEIHCTFVTVSLGLQNTAEWTGVYLLKKKNVDQKGVSDPIIVHVVQFRVEMHCIVCGSSAHDTTHCVHCVQTMPHTVHAVCRRYHTLYALCAHGATHCVHCVATAPPRVTAPSGQCPAPTPHSSYPPFWKFLTMATKEGAEAVFQKKMETKWKKRNQQLRLHSGRGKINFWAFDASFSDHPLDWYSQLFLDVTINSISIIFAQKRKNNNYN